MIDNQLEFTRLYDRQVRGFRTLEDAAGVEANVMIRFADARTVAHQSAHFRMFAVLINRGYRMAGSQLRQLDTSGEQERTDPDEKRVGPLARERGEGSIDLADSAGIEDLHLYSHRSDAHFEFSQRGLRSPRIGRVDERGNTNDPRQE